MSLSLFVVKVQTHNRMGTQAHATMVLYPPKKDTWAQHQKKLHADNTPQKIALRGKWPIKHGQTLSRGKLVVPVDSPFDKSVLGSCRPPRDCRRTARCDPVVLVALAVGDTLWELFVEGPLLTGVGPWQEGRVLCTIVHQVWSSTCTSCGP